MLSFVYHGRNLTIRTTQPQQECVLEMVEHLEQRAENDGEFSDVVYSYYLDGEGQYIAEITLVAHHYDEQNLSEELEKFLPKHSNPKHLDYGLMPEQNRRNKDGTEKN